MGQYLTYNGKELLFNGKYILGDPLNPQFQEDPNLLGFYPFDDNLNEAYGRTSNMVFIIGENYYAGVGGVGKSIDIYEVGPSDNLLIYSRYDHYAAGMRMDYYDSFAFNIWCYFEWNGALRSSTIFNIYSIDGVNIRQHIMKYDLDNGLTQYRNVAGNIETHNKALTLSAGWHMFTWQQQSDPNGPWLEFIYIDGSLFDSYNWSYLFDNFGFSAVKTFFATGNSFADDHLIDYFRAYSKPISIDMITQLYNNGLGR